MANYNINYFNFKQFDDKYLLTNDSSKFIFVNKDEFHRLVQNEDLNDDELLSKLKDKHFIFDGHKELFVDKTSHVVRKQKAFLFEGTQLHILVLTKECNQRCVYCQASSLNSPLEKENMTYEIAEKAIDIIFQSPSQNLTIEFQGGEPLINFPTLKHIVEYVKIKNSEINKNITFNLVSNLIEINDDSTNFLIDNEINICTSLDGNKYLHMLNRPCAISDYFDRLVSNINKINSSYFKKLNQNKVVQAIQTTTKNSLGYSREIVDTYISLGFKSLFLRPLTPLGYAKERWDKIGYTPEEFLSFYKETLEYIIELNTKGIYFSETYTTILLKKILSSIPLNFMELRSPCGGGVGQMAYHYNGNIYTCDEARMLSETGDESFKLGDVYTTTYNQLINNPITKTLCISSCLETIPGCQECAYSPYCGTCPIFNYVQGGSIFSLMPQNYKCKINKGIMDFIFEKIKNNDSTTLDIFNKWIN